MKIAPFRKRNVFYCLALALIATGALDIFQTATCQAADSPMISAWRRTFWAQDDLKSPLRGFFLPRRPNCDCWGATYGEFGCTPITSDGLTPNEFVRLGQIPNDSQMGGAAAPAAGR